MCDDLSQRLQANDLEHRRLMYAVEEGLSEVGSLQSKLSNLQQALGHIANQPRSQELARGTPVCESSVAFQSATLKDETDLRALFDKLAAVVTCKFFGVIPT